MAGAESSNARVDYLQGPVAPSAKSGVDSRWIRRRIVHSDAEGERVPDEKKSLEQVRLRRHDVSRCAKSLAIHCVLVVEVPPVNRAHLHVGLQPIDRVRILDDHSREHHSVAGHPKGNLGQNEREHSAREKQRRIPEP